MLKTAKNSKKTGDNSNGTVDNSKKTAKPRGKPFAPGESGNPGGRPRLKQEQRDALEAIRDLAPQTPAILSAIMADAGAPPAQRLKAVEMILDRTYGKPDMAVRLEDPKTDVLAEIREEVAQIKAASILD